MPETKKIRFTKDGFFGIQAGDELPIREDPNHTVKFITMDNQEYRLDDIEGFYEVLRYRPQRGEWYWFVTDSGKAIKTPWLDVPDDQFRHEAQNCQPDTREGEQRARLHAVQIRAIFKEGV